MAILTVTNINKSFGENNVLSNITFSINKNDKVAIIGDNGEGKSTLLKILTKQLYPDSGSVIFESNTTVGYLSQEVISDPENTLIEEMEIAFSHLKKIEREMAELVEKISFSSNNEDINRYSHLEEQYSIKGGYEYKFKIEMMLNKFGFNSTFYNRKIKSFSGGEKTRACLVKLLLNNPNVLLLDEPTNHLDLIMIEWLEKYLKTYPGTVLIVSHDRVFVDNLVDKIIEIENHKCEIYPGNYTYYSKEKIARYEQKLKQYNLQEKEIRRYDMLIRKFKPKPTKTSFAQSLELKLKKMEKIEKPTMNKKTIKTSFKTNIEHKVLMHKAYNLMFGFNNIPLTNPFSLDIYNQDKVCIMGQNGSGKTTLIQCLMSNKNKLSGENYDVRDLKYFYFDQNQDILDPNKNLFDTIQDEFPLMTNTEVRNLLGRFLFVEDDVFKTVKTLSGGEKMRLIFALISLRDYQILYLDEPTNHLDFATKQVIADILEDYQGTIIMVSHDRYFINRVANKIIYLQNKNFIIEEGNYEHFCTIHNIENNAFTFGVKTQKKENSVSKETPIKKSNKKEIEKIEKQIIQKEDLLNKLNKKLNNEQANYDWLEYKELQDEIEKIELELHDLLIKLENI